MTAVEAAIVSEEAGRALVPGPIVEGLVAGSLGGADPGTTTIAPFDSDLVIERGRATGELRLVPAAERCRTALVRHADGVFAVDLDAPGVAVHATPGVDRVGRPCTVSLDGAELDRVGSSEDGESVERLMHCLVAARLLGMIDALLELTVGYVTVREQFGRPIGSFQAVQQTAADLAKLGVAARSACYASQAAIAERRADGGIRARAAKAYASRAARTSGEAAVQLHGGIGFTTEVPVHLFLKHTLALQSAWGDERDHDRALAAVALRRREPRT
jgi:alkylation response protein AidB-like acyl-CoA dehydrogenase